MSYLRLIGIAILAILAVSAVVASGASAAAKISYSGNGQFTITSGAGQLETVGGVQITCKSDVGNGKLATSPATSAELTVSFRGCAFLGIPCTSTGGTSGLIDTVKLLATLGDVNPTTVGALLKPASGSEFLVPVKCGEAAFTVKGSVIGAFTNTVDKPTNLLTIKFALKPEEKGKQAITEFENEKHTNVLESTIEGKTEVAGLESTEDLLLKEGTGDLLA